LPDHFPHRKKFLSLLGLGQNNLRNKKTFKKSTGSKLELVQKDGQIYTKSNYCKKCTSSKREQCAKFAIVAFCVYLAIFLN